MIVWLTIILLVVSLVLAIYRRRHIYRLTGNIVDLPDALPVIGITHKLAGNNEDIIYSLQSFSYSAMQHDGIVKGWLGPVLYFVAVDPTDLECILKSCLEKDDLTRFLRKVNGNGAIFAPVSIWRRRRKVIVPAFSPKIVENYVEVFSEQSERLAEKLSKRADTGTFSVWPYVNTYTLDSVCETTMNVQVNAQGNADSPFLLAVNRVLQLVCERMFHLWLQPDWLYRFFPQYPDHQRCVKLLHDFTDEVIKRKREEIKKEAEYKTEADHDYDLGSYQRKSFLDLLISTSGGENGCTDMELREEALTMIIAGTDTSAVAIAFTLKLLRKYPAVQEQLFEELDEVFGNSDRPLVKEDLFQLKYLDRVVKESLRLYPPVPFVIRKVTDDTPLPSGRVLPAGTGVMVSIWGAHRDPKYWGPDAEQFDPDRFLPERYKPTHACSYMPFSNGPRNCVGYQYALMSVKTALASVLRRYRVVGDEGPGPIRRIRVKLDIMMKDVEGYQIAFEKRQTTTTNGRHL